MVGLAFLIWMAAGGALPQDAVPPAAGASPPAAGALQFEAVRYRDRVEEDARHLRTMEVQVRLFTAQGVAEFGQIGAPYVDGYVDVQFEDVVIEKADGRRVEVTNGLVEDVNPFGVTSTSASADLRFRKMTIPGLEPGDRLSYRLAMREKPFAPGRAFGEIRFPAFTTAVHTYELDLPRNAPVKVKLRQGLGVEWEAVPSAPDRLVRRLSLKNDAAPPSEKADPGDPAEPDVAFTSFGSWKEVAEWWWGISKDRLAPDAAIEKEAKALIATAQTPKEKLAALHAFLTGRIRYVNVSFGLGRMQPRLAADVLANRYGDCKDKHALLAALAASLEIDVRPVLINSERADLQDEVPNPRQFDHLISVARLGSSPEDWLWLDGTNAFGGPGYLLPALRDKRALLVESDGSATLVRTPKDPPYVPRQEVAVKGRLGPDGVLRTRVTWEIRADLEVDLRAWLANTPNDQRASAIGSAFGRAWGGDPVTNLMVSDPQDMSAPLRIEFDAEKTIEAKGSERSLWMPLSGFALPDPTDDPPPGKPAVTFRLREIAERAEIEIPVGQEARAPLSVKIERPFGTFRSAYSLEGRTLKLERRLSLSQSSLPASEVVSYEAFRSAIGLDHKQEFTVTGVGATAEVATAKSLHAEGLAAFKKRDFAKAAELFARAGEADAKEPDVFVDLGRSLIDQRKYEESVLAFSRQIEVTPFHETAYGWRAHSRRELGDWPGAEQDFQKQIELAPFQTYAYQELARRRAFQGRYAEAADLYARVATLEPKVASRWVDLARAQAKAGRPEEARRSLEQPAVRDAADFDKLKAAAVYRSMGDAAAAGRLAAETLPSLTARLAKVTRENVGDGDAQWTSRLSEAWLYVGQAAAAAGDTARAEAYLRAAWGMDLSPEAAWSLGELEEKRGRLAEAVDLWVMASAIPSGWFVLPTDRQSRITAAIVQLPEVPLPPSTPPPGVAGAYEVFADAPRETKAKARLKDLRTVSLAGPALGDLSEEVLLLADAEGRVERILNLSRKSPEAFETQLGKLEPARLEWPHPDEYAPKAIRKGMLKCAAASGCAVVLHMPAREPHPTEGAGSIRIVTLDPPEGTTLRRGQQVSVVATARYDVAGDGAWVALLVKGRKDAGRGFSGMSSTNVKAGQGDVRLTTTFTVSEDATQVEVIVPLTAAGGRGTVSASATYAVR